ncbi:MAG: PKD domain-containing protein [Pedobacter sp.]|uniref:PKD domain-containing protein n=1 Tax=Pedobacter sp. TaxID=1411316 RepID=UPI00356A6918
MKLARILFLSFFCALTFPTFAQLNIATVDPGPYVPGSTISATFTLDPATCVRPGNVFQLYLSDASGNFGSEVLIGTYNGFYSAFVNGTIPNGTVPGTGYKLRIKSTIPPAIVSLESSTFEIKAGVASSAALSSGAALSPEAFGFCSGRTTNNTINLTNQSTPTSNVTVTIENKLNGGAPTIIPFDTSIKQFTPQLAHYTAFVKAVMPDGTVSTRTYFIINNNVNTSFTTSNQPIVCLPGGALQYFIDVSSPTGIQNNFPGNIYTINWGDGSPSNTYTFCDLQGGTVSHSYTQSSCGQINNAFSVNIQASNVFCGTVGTPVSTIAKVVTITENRINGPLNGCTNSNVTFTNTSILGQNPSSNSPNCTDNNVRFNWYVNGQIVLADVPYSTAYSRVFNTPGNYRITLESTSETNCQGPPVDFFVCIQNPPIPSFTLPSTTGCAPFNITPTNTSVVDISCNNNITYVWSVSPTTGVIPTSFSSNSPTPPAFNFSQPGIYTISLIITTPNCGTTTAFTRTVTVNNLRTVDLSPSTTLCNPTTFNFSTAAGPTRTVYSGNETVLDDVYSWTVTSNNGGTYTFLTPATSKYPTIRFNNFDVYTITSTVTNVCGTTSDTQVITFTQSPVPDITLTKNPICYNEIANLTGNVTGTYNSIQWVNSAGTSVGFSDPTNLITTYTPTTAERNAGSAIITLRVITGLTGTCATVTDNITLNILPNNTGTNATQTICTGGTATYTPTSSVTGSTFIWTATNADGNATSFSASGTGIISDDIINTNPTANAVVVYTITPSANGCTGNPFTFTVTVTPNPIVTPTAANTTICSGQSTGITLTSNLGPTTKYTWTSVATGGVTGNTNQPAPTATLTINDVLLNSGTSAGTVTFTITPISANGCPGTPVPITITVEPQPTQPNAGPDESICNTTNYTLKGNQPVVGTGKWTEISGISGVTFDDETVYNTTVRGLQPSNVYTFRWTITGAASCTPKTDDVSITVNPVSVGGTTAGDAPVCAGNNTGTITLSGHIGNVIRWESSTDGGTTWLPITNTTTTLTYTNLTTTTQYRAVVQSGVCAPANSSISTITVNQGAVAANAGQDQNLCNESTTILAGNDPAPNTGLWTLISGQTGVTFTANQFNTSVSGLVGGQTYIFRWTVSGLAPCPATSDDIVITNLPALQNNSITTTPTTVCTGQTITLVGSTPTGGNNVYTYTWQSSSDGGTTWNPINGQTNRDLTLTVSTSLSYRRIVNSGTCSSTSAPIAVTVLPPIATNTIATDQTICITTTPNQLTGSQPTGGDGTNYTYQWEQSIDNGATWSLIASANARNYAPPAITQTTLYRRLVSSGACTGSQQSISNVVKITVNLNAKAEFTYTNDIGCVPFQLDGNNIKAVQYPTRNATYTWFANGTQIGTGINFPGYTINTDNTDVVIKLVVTSSLGCLQDEMSHTFSTRQTIAASYTQTATEGCGPLDVTFTNTSTSLTGVTFLWDFGNGTTSNLASPPPITFLTDPTGKDITYTVTLTATTPCGSSTATSTVFIKANPISVFSPDKTVGCSPFTVNFSNTSPGGTNTYTYDFGDGSPTFTTTNKNSVSHTYTTGNTIRTYIVTMTAENDCGTNQSQYSIQVSPNTITPELVVNSNELRGCAPLTVHFFNNTSGANSFTYTFGDGATATTLSAPETVTHIFTQPGTYTVRLDATNGCSNASTTETITVLPQPKAEFHGDTLVGCAGLNVKFTNTSTDGVSYLWEFGDGATSRDVEPSHIYSGPAGSYTVRLTTYNNLGCPNTATLTDYIRIVGPPRADFSISPAPVISIPTYTFKFTDESTNSPKTYKWTFGDGDASLQRDPTHTYADTGKYIVTMRTYNEYGCVDSIQKQVQIIGVPGYMYVPNSFIPGGTSTQLQKFTAIGSGIKSWHMSVFNKWGQVLWETTQLNDGKPVEGWDGTYKNTPQPQGIYFWKIDIEFINGTEWKGMTYDSSPPKRTGSIYLIR